MPATHAEHRSFWATDLGGGALIAIAAVLALVVANSPLAGLYDRLLDTPLVVKVGQFGLDKPLLLWINDGLMAVFFCLVGLEIRKELTTGHLSTVRQASLPAIAALGGMAVPAVVYLLTLALKGVPTSDIAWNGWAIPAATDIAFALAVLAIAGSRAPAALKVFLLALAIIDDLGAIVIIALFYTASLSAPALIAASVALAVLIGLRRRDVHRLAPYILVGVALWFAVLKSGVHATLAGVVLAFALPGRSENGEDLAEKVMHGLEPWVRYAILPVFAFANAGVSLSGAGLGQLFAPVPLAILLGLVVGKPIGIFFASFAAVRAGIAVLPDGLRWGHIVGVGAIAGIGFTMSLFIGMLAFPSADAALPLRLGVLAGSLISAAIGLALLSRLANERPNRQTATQK